MERFFSKCFAAASCKSSVCLVSWPLFLIISRSPCGQV